MSMGENESRIVSMEDCNWNEHREESQQNKMRWRAHVAAVSCQIHVIYSHFHFNLWRCPLPYLFQFYLILFSELFGPCCGSESFSSWVWKDITPPDLLITWGVPQKLVHQWRVAPKICRSDHPGSKVENVLIPSTKLILRVRTNWWCALENCLLTLYQQ